MATKKKVEASFSPVDQTALLGELEKVCQIQSVTLGTEDRISTGNLCMDFIMGGGLSPSMVTMAGGEQSAKTTTALTMMAASVNQKVDLRTLWDAEGSSGSSTDYVSNIFATAGTKCDMETLFGVKDKKGKFIQNPLVYYRDEGSMDTYFNWLTALLKRLPDKRFQDNQWWYIYPATRENKGLYAGKYDRTMSAANGAIYIPAPDGSLQALIIIDSYPSLNPTSMDEDDPKAGMALQAREFARNMPRVKGKLRAKRVVIIGINQLREKPGFNMGDPRYEPGGQALRFYSDIRCWFTARALSGVPPSPKGPPKGKGQFEEEEAISGTGVDKYRYVAVKAIKNKLAIPNRETWLRIWVADEFQQAHGLCPVWDTFYIMHVTGQVSGRTGAMLLNVHGLGPAKKSITWTEFKKLIIGTPQDIEKICAKMGYRPINLRKGMFNMMRKGTIEDLFSKTRASSGKKVLEVDVKADDDDDDEDAE